MWDKTTGKPIYNAIVWQCRRTTDRCKELKTYAPMIKEKTGLPLDPYFSATKIEWLLNNGHKLDINNLCVGTIDTWLIWNLTNGKYHITDHSNASRTMLYNINTHQFDDDLLALFNIPRHILPTIVDSCGELAITDASVTGTELPILSIIGDQQAALFCQCGTSTTKIKNTYGTGLFMMVPTGQDRPQTEALVNTVAWSINGKIDYALEGSIFIGGSAIQWLRDGLGLITDSSETAELAHTLTSNEGVYFVPALTGLGTPYWDASARGMIIGLTRGTTRAHIARATLEALAYQTKDVIDEIIKTLPNTPFDALLVDGGATENPFLMQFQADILDLPLIKPTITETTAFGAALLAGLTAELWTETDIQTLNPIQETITPSMDSATRQRYYSKWKEAVERCQGWV